MNTGLRLLILLVIYGLVGCCTPACDSDEECVLDNCYRVDEYENYFNDQNQMQCVIYSDPQYNAYCEVGYECCGDKCCNNDVNFYCDTSDKYSYTCGYFEERPPLSKQQVGGISSGAVLCGCYIIVTICHIRQQKKEEKERQEKLEQRKTNQNLINEQQEVVSYEGSDADLQNNKFNQVKVIPISQPMTTRQFVPNNFNDNLNMSSVQNSNGNNLLMNKIRSKQQQVPSQQTHSRNPSDPFQPNVDQNGFSQNQPNRYQNPGVQLNLQNQFNQPNQYGQNNQMNQFGQYNQFSNNGNLTTGRGGDMQNSNNIQTIAMGNAQNYAYQPRRNQN